MGKFSVKVVSKEQERTQFASSFARLNHWRILYEQGVDIRYNEEESSDNKDSGFETTILASKKTFEPHDTCFGGQK
jgi:hypothetical protein